MYPSSLFKTTMIVGMALLLTVVPFVYYRMTYTHSKRLRVVEEGKVYRSGCMTAEGFVDAIKAYKIRTIINLRDEAPDPQLPMNWFDRRTISEKALCDQHGVNFIFLALELSPPDSSPAQHPKTIDRFLSILDDPANYPLLFHCQAGLHRTGLLAAIYRMEKDHWSVGRAMRELKDHGFGEYYSSSANPYIAQYVLSYQRRRPLLGHELHRTAADNPGDPVGLTPPYHNEKAPPEHE